MYLLVASALQAWLTKPGTTENTSYHWLTQVIDKTYCVKGNYPTLPMNQGCTEPISLSPPYCTLQRPFHPWLPIYSCISVSYLSLFYSLSDSLLSPCRLQGLNSSHQARWQSPLQVSPVLPSVSYTCRPQTPWRLEATLPLVSVIPVQNSGREMKKSTFLKQAKTGNRTIWQVKTLAVSLSLITRDQLLNSSKRGGLTLKSCPELYAHTYTIKLK